MVDPKASRCRRLLSLLFKLALCGACLYGLQAQCKLILDIYFSHPYDVLLINKKQTNLTFPSVTLCTDSWIDLDADVCLRDPEFCTFYGQVISVGLFRIQYDPWLADSMAHYPRDIFKCTMRSLTKECQSFDCTDHMRRTLFWPTSKFCYTLDNTMYSTPVHPFRQCKTPWMYDLELTSLWTNRSQALMDSQELPLLIQGPSSVIPGVAPVYLEFGKYYSLSVQQMVFERLPHPFESNCTDYEAAGPQRRFFGFGYQEACKQWCLLELEVKICGCFLSELHQYGFPSAPGMPCTLFQTMSCFDSVPFDDCVEACQPACRDVMYDVRTAGIRDLVKEDGTKDKKRLEIKVRFRDDHVMYSIEQPSQSVIEILGYFGGFIGVWLGISLLDVLNTIEYHIVGRHKKMVEFFHQTNSKLPFFRGRVQSNGTP